MFCTDRHHLKLPFMLLFLFCLTNPALAMKNQLQPGGFYLGQVPDGSRAFYGDRPLQIAADNKFLIGFGRDADLEQRVSLVDREGHETILTLQLQPRKYQIENINGISKKMMDPSNEDLQRISQEAEQARRARQSRSELPDFRQTFIWPLKGRISGVYGSQRILNGEPRQPHFGIDIAAQKGTAVVAPAGGIVRMAHQGMFFSGKTLIIDHGFGLSSSFLHLSQILVEEGQKVTQGEKIALVGRSGRVTGPHLDWRINWFEKRLDPALFAPPLP